MICDFCKQPMEPAMAGFGCAVKTDITYHRGCYQEAASIFLSYKALVAAVAEAHGAMAAITAAVSVRWATDGISDMSEPFRRIVLRVRAAIERIDKLGVNS